MFTEDVARETLEKIIAEALSDAGVKRSAVQAICLGLSGVNHSKDQEKILGWLRFACCTNLLKDIFACGVNLVCNF